jgi:hypothetical protein
MQQLNKPGRFNVTVVAFLGRLILAASSETTRNIRKFSILNMLKFFVEQK